MHCLLLSVFALLSLLAISNTRTVQSNTNSNVGLHRLKRHLIKGVQFKRSMLDNRIEPYEELTEEQEAQGEQMMEDFLQYLLLKETGMLDMCLQDLF